LLNENKFKSILINVRERRNCDKFYGSA